MIKKINKKIIPNKIIYNGKIYNIIKLNEKFIIKYYFVEINDENKLIKNIILDSKHPNCDNRIFCLPKYLTNLKFDKTSQNLIENLLSVFNANNSYFSPWKYIEYKKYISKEKKYYKSYTNLFDDLLNNFFNELIKLFKGI